MHKRTLSIDHGPIELVPDPPMPSLPGRVILRPDADAVITALAMDLVLQAKACARRFGSFHLALSGGSTPMPLYRRLMFDPAFRDLPWRLTHLWMVDERRVPLDDERSNFGQIREFFTHQSGMPREQIHPMPIGDDGDVRYERELRSVLEWRERGHDRLDFVVLGMGGDLHTASLFPGSRALDAGADRLVVLNDGFGVTPPPRITMTFSLLNASRSLAVLVLGEGKRAAIQRLATEHPPPREAPIAGLKPLAGELRWYLDYGACPGAELPDAHAEGS